MQQHKNQILKELRICKKFHRRVWCGAKAPHTVGGCAAGCLHNPAGVSVRATSNRPCTGKRAVGLRPSLAAGQTWLGRRPNLAVPSCSSFFCIRAWVRTKLISTFWLAARSQAKHGWWPRAVWQPARKQTIQQACKHVSNHASGSAVRAYAPGGDWPARCGCSPCCVAAVPCSFQSKTPRRESLLVTGCLALEPQRKGLRDTSRCG